MMLRIGTEIVYRNRNTTYDIRHTEHGFTLVEIMVTAAVLSLAAVLIYQTFFPILDTFNYCADYLALAPLLDEKIWQAQDYLRRLGPEAVLETEGALPANNKSVGWNLSCAIAGNSDTKVLYGIELYLFLARGPNKVRISRSAYALYKYEEKEN